MTPPLPPAFLGAPLSHRALHNSAAGIAENSGEAIQAAVAAGYGIELDVQLTRDGEAIVFHDDDLRRLTGARGRVRDQTAAQMTERRLSVGGCRILTLADALGVVAGKSAVLIELKDQSGRMEGSDGALETAVARATAGYDGPVAAMSFNPDMVHCLRNIAPELPRGLTTCAWISSDGLRLARNYRQRLTRIADFDEVGAAFISHEAARLGAPRVQTLRRSGVPVLTWTIRSPAAEAKARLGADNVTFEGYRPPLRP